MFSTIRLQRYAILPPDLCPHRRRKVRTLKGGEENNFAAALSESALVPSFYPRCGIYKQPLVSRERGFIIITSMRKKARAHKRAREKRRDREIEPRCTHEDTRGTIVPYHVRGLRNARRRRLMSRHSLRTFALYSASRLFLRAVSSGFKTREKERKGERDSEREGGK